MNFVINIRKFYVIKDRKLWHLAYIGKDYSCPVIFRLVDVHEYTLRVHRFDEIF